MAAPPCTQDMNFVLWRRWPTWPQKLTLAGSCEAENKYFLDEWTPQLGHFAQSSIYVDSELVDHLVAYRDTFTMHVTFSIGLLLLSLQLLIAITTALFRVYLGLCRPIDRHLF